MKFSLYILFFFIVGLHSREITFLPSSVSGVEPASLKKKDKLDTGLSELVSYYAKENFLVDISEFDKVKSFISEQTIELNRKPSKLFLSRICEEFSSDFIAHSEVIFDDKISFFTEVYSCRGKVISSHESIIEKDFYNNLEKHTKKAFSFLTPKTKDKILYESSNKDEIIFCLDLSGGLSRELKDIFDYIETLSIRDVAIGLVAISNSETKIIKPNFNHKELLTTIKYLKFSGEVGLDRITSGLLKAKSELLSSKIKTRKFIFFTDVKSNKDSDSTYISALQGIRELGFQISLISGSYFDFKSVSLHKKASRSVSSKDYTNLIHSQMIKTSRGNKTLFLKDRIIYIEDGEKNNFEDLEFNSMQKIEENRVFTIVDSIHPSNISEIYSKLVSPVTEKFSIKSNIKLELDKALSNKTTNWSGVKVLISMGSTSFWLNFNSLPDSYIDQEIAIRTSFIKDNFSSSGVNNIGKETEVYTEDVPKLLILEPKQIKNFVNNNSVFQCFVKGRVLEIKN